MTFFIASAPSVLLRDSRRFLSSAGSCHRDAQIAHARNGKDHPMSHHVPVGTLRTLCM